MLLGGLVVSTLYWIIVFVSAFWGARIQGQFVRDLLLPGDPVQLWLRLAIVIFLIASTTYAYFLMDTRRRAQAEAYEVQERFRLAFDNASIGMALTSPDGQFLQVNDTLCRMLGSSEEQLLSSTFRDFTHPDDRSVSAEYIRRALGGEVDTYRLEKRYIHTNGHIIWGLLNVSLVKDERGCPLYFVAQVQDITVRKRAEEASFRLAAIVESSNDAILGKTLDGTITDWNFAAENLYGYTPEEAIGQNVSMLAPPDRPNEISWILEKIRKGEKVDHYETLRLTKDGRYLEVEITVSPVRDSEGKVTGASAIGRDITERKRAEEEIRRLNEELEERVQRRTSELKESEERYRLVLQGSNDGIWDRDLRTDEIYWNDRLYEIFGFSVGEVKPTYDLFFEIVHPEDREVVDDTIKAHLEWGSEYEVEYRAWQRSTGEYRTCVSRGEAQCDGNGYPIRMAGIVQDITERKEREKRRSFLAEVSEVLSSSLDYKATLASVANLTVPTMADWCAVDILEDSSLNRLAVAHRNPEKVEWAYELYKKYPPDPDAPRGVPKVLRTGEPEIYTEITDETLETLARDEEHLRLLRGIGFRSVMIVPLSARGSTLGALLLATAETGRVYGDQDFSLAKELARRAALAMDNARLYQEAQKEIARRMRAEEELKARARQQGAIADLGQRALANAELLVLMGQAVSLTARILGVEYVKVLELLPGKEALLLRSGVGWKEGFVGKAIVESGTDSQAGHALFSSEPVIVEDLGTETRFSGPRLLHEHGVVSGVSVVIPGYERPFGVLGVHATHQRTYTEDDISFLQAVANVLATAVERERAEQVMMEIREAEQRRIARDLHDVVFQDVAGTLQSLQATHIELGRSGIDVSLEQEMVALRRGVGGLRNAIYDLQTEKEQPFIQAVESLVEYSRQMTPESRVTLFVEEGFPEVLADNTGVQLLRIIQEALANARKHSGAWRVEVCLRKQGDELMVEVCDDGRGFDPFASVSDSMGTSSMRQRAQEIGGELEVESERGGGACVRFRAPAARLIQ